MAIAQSKRKTSEELEEEIKALESAEQGEDNGNSEQEVPEAKAEEIESEKDVKEEPQKADKSSDQDDDKTDWKKRFGDLRRHSQTQINELKEQIKGLKTSNQEVRPLASDESVSEWKEKYPEIASIVETVADRIAEEKFERAQIDLDEIKEFKQETTKGQIMAKIRKAHSDFDEIVATDAFEEWIDEQPKWANDALYSSSHDAKSAIRVLDLYKADMGLTKEAKKKSTMDAAKTVKTKSTPDIQESDPQYLFSESQIERMSGKEYAENEEAILKAQREGKLLLDLSGGAR